MLHYDVLQYTRYTDTWCSCTCIYVLSFCRSLPDDYDGHLYEAHCEVLYSTLLIHLDDPSEQMQVIGY